LKLIFENKKKGLPIGKPLDNDSIYINYKIASAPTLTCAA
jgi:outer membrane receptor for monomeric catechols